MPSGPNMIESDDVPLRSKKNTVLSSPTNQARASPDSRTPKVGATSANGKLRRQNSVGVVAPKGKSAIKPSVGGYLYQTNGGAGLKTPIRATEKVSRADSMTSKEGKVSSLKQLLTKSTSKGVAA
jgi:hypothetical protein